MSGVRELLIINKNVIKHLHLKTSLFGQLSKTRFNPWVHSGSQLSQIKQNYDPFRFDYAIKCIIHQKMSLIGSEKILSIIKNHFLLFSKNYLTSRSKLAEKFKSRFQKSFSDTG